MGKVELVCDNKSLTQIYIHMHMLICFDVNRQDAWPDCYPRLCLDGRPSSPYGDLADIGLTVQKSDRESYQA